MFKNYNIHLAIYLYFLPFLASPLRVYVSTRTGMLSAEDGFGLSHYINSKESLRSHASDYLTALSSLLSSLFSASAPTATDQTHSD